jgi:hypothetical protein
VRRTRRISHVRLRGTDVQPSDSDRDRRHGRARRIRVHGSGDATWGLGTRGLGRLEN